MTDQASITPPSSPSLASTRSSTRARSRSEEKRRLIIEAAADLFTEQGFEVTSMDAIAERAGVSKQTVYSHFGNKEGVFEASVQHRCFVNSLEPDFFCTQRPTAEMLLDLVRHFHQLLMSEEAVRLVRLCESNAIAHPQLSALFYEAGPANLQNMLTDYLQRKVELGQLQIEQPRFAANQLMFMVSAESAMRRRLGIEVRETPAEIDAYLESCVTLFLRGYSNPDENTHRGDDSHQGDRHQGNQGPA